jgi:predicted dehydrogenase
VGRVTRLDTGLVLNPVKSTLRVVVNFTESYIDASPRPFWRILGTKGAIVDDYGAQIPGYQKQINAASCGKIRVFKGDIDGGTIQRYESYKDSDWDVFYTDLANHILNGEPNPVPGEVGRRVLGIVDAAKKSCQSGQTESVAFS